MCFYYVCLATYGTLARKIDFAFLKEVYTGIMLDIPFGGEFHLTYIKVYVGQKFVVIILLLLLCCNIVANV